MIGKGLRTICSTAPRVFPVNRRLGSIVRENVSRGVPRGEFQVFSAAAGAAAGLLILISQSQEQGSSDQQRTSFCMGDVSSYNFIADAADVASPTIVNILVDVKGPWGSQGIATGSGFIIDGEAGLIATNAHVVAAAAQSGSRLLVTLNDGRKFVGRVHSLDRQLDVALVQLEKHKGWSALPAAKFGSSTDLRAGEWVVALGSPLHLQNTVTAGIVSSTARGASEIGMGEQNYEYIQTDASINQGNSGGPLVNLRGEVIGINTAKLGGQHVSGISFAIPIDTASAVLHQLRKYGVVRRPFLGIKFHSSLPDPRLSDRNRQQGPGVAVSALAYPTKVKVLDVAPGSPAEQGGLREGDVILEFDRRPVEKNRDIIERLGYEYGRAIEVKVQRAGGHMETLTIVSAEPKGLR